MMKLQVFFGVCLLLGLAYAAPTSDVDKVIVNKELFPDSFVKYTSEHDIVNILLPLNDLNFEVTDDGNINSDSYVFFVEADTDHTGKRVDKGLYVMKNYHVTKLLDHGRDAAAAIDKSKDVFFGAKEGLYVYDTKENKAKKYGPFTDSIISIAKVNGSDIIYYLTEDHVLYKVTDEGTKKTKVDNVVNAKQIVLDYKNNLYYHTADKHVYVYNADGVKKIEGIPTGDYVYVLKPPFFTENGVLVIVDNKAYGVYANGTYETTNFEFTVKPTAYATEAGVIQYFAYDKKIYEFNFFDMILNELGNELLKLLDDNIAALNEIASKSRAHLKYANKTSAKK